MADVILAVEIVLALLFWLIMAAVFLAFPAHLAWTMYQHFKEGRRLRRLNYRYVHDQEGNLIDAIPYVEYVEE